VGGIPEIAHLGSCSLVRPRDPQSLAGAIAARLDATATNCRSAYRRSHAESAAELGAFFAEVVARVGRRATGATPAGYVEPRAASLQTS